MGGLQPGQRIWIRCDVRPGAFSNERLVRAYLPNRPWLGFAEESALRDRITNGTTAILALVMDVTGDQFSAQVMGQGLSSDVFQGDISKVKVATSRKAN